MENKPQALRPLSVKQNSTEVSVLVPADIWVLAEQLKEEFPIQTDQVEDEVPDIELSARFLHFASQRASKEEQFLPVARTVFVDFGVQYLKNNDVHAITRSLSSDSEKVVLQAYFSALVVLKKHQVITAKEAAPAQSALFAAAQRGEAKIFAIFGGQGNIEEYFDEMADLCDTYDGLVQPFIERMAGVLANYARSSEASVFHSKGLDVMRWLKNPEIRPDLQYLVSAPVSLPLIGLTQLLHYYVMLRVMDCIPGDIIKLINGTTGHSQGIISSVVISSSTTYEEFLDNAERALGLLFWMGTRAQQAFPPTTLNPTILEDSLNNNEGTPTPMLAVNGLRESQVLKHLEATNAHLAPDRQVEIALHNGPRSFVCTGPPQSLYGLNLSLRKLKAPTGLDQSRVPYSQRKIKFSSRFLPITAPFHSSYLQPAFDTLMRDVERYHLQHDAKDLKIPVYATDSGVDLRSSTSLTSDLVSLIYSHHVHWEKAIAPKDLTHIIDFGPGGTSGVGGLTYRNKEGTGAQVLLAGALEGGNRDLSYKADLFDADLRAVTYSQNWAKLFQPKLIKTTSNGRIHVDTRMSRLLGKPPLMVAGMTPSTVSEKFVSAVMNAGYHVELAGGAHYNEKALRGKVDKIMNLTRPGEGITLNILFLNVRQWGFQYPLVQVMRKEGLPMEGICVAAGVPSLDVANEVISNVQAAGIRHVAFKPGSVETIRQVISIAAANPTMPIIMQWTGGRAGGHHSFEDVHQPILETYASIRRQDNLVLIAGSGFGGADDTLPYITGEWSSKFGYPPMPFDGVLFGSRMMVSKEGLASDAAKQAMVDAPGVDDGDWEKTYKGPTGGIMTVRSELGEPIHKVATRGVRLWKELDETIFSLPRDKRLPALLAKKDYIIRRLNADFQKVWFGKKENGDVVDLQDMTYTEVVDRMVELLYIKHERRWIDITLRNLLGDFLRRIEERFSKAQATSTLQSYSQLDHPHEFTAEFLAQFPQAKSQLLTSEDVLHFFTLCQRRGQKPVPFIPVMDKDFDVWFKKDSLWQSEDLGAVVDQDVQRTCILHGPVAAKYATRVDQPVGEILGDIYNSHIASLKEKYYNNDESLIPEVEYLGGASNTANKLIAADSSSSPNEKIYYTGDSDAALPQDDDWFQTIAGVSFNWLRALVTSPFVVQNKNFSDNPLARILRPRAGQKVTVTSNTEGKVVSLNVQDKRLWSASGKTEDYVTSVEATYAGANIDVTLYEKRDADYVPLKLHFLYKPEFGYAPIHEIMDGRNNRIKEFYWKLWFGINAKDDFLSIPVTENLIGMGETVKSAEIKEFCQAVGNQAEVYVDRGQKMIYAPMDFAIVVGWKAIIKAIFPREIDGDLLKLVHLSNGFRLLEGGDLLSVGDVVDTYAKINAIVNNDSGKLIEVKGVIAREGKAVMEVTSQFLYRGNFTDFEHTFERKVETPMNLNLQSVKDIAVLKSKEWIDWTEELDNYELSPGTSLVFRLTTELHYLNKRVFASVKTTGTVDMKVSTKEFVKVANVNYEAGESHGNPVIEYLKRNGQEIEQAHFFENGGYSVMPAQSIYSSVVHAPASNEPYANVSGDYNPIHVNPYFADLAVLPGTITHGMWTSASTRKFVEIFAADNVPRRVVAYSVQFMGMVLPSDRLETKLSHTGMKNGRKIIQIETINQNSEKVVVGTAEVEQPVTAYVFTGQGSQEQGMGMALYNSSNVAKEIWDRADKHFMENYGFSILEIVRLNPKEKIVHFGGPRGNKIRQNYMSMTYDVVESDSSIKTLPLFPTINERTSFYTFQAPNGLLSATQFTQPALTLLEKAAFEDMRSKELIQSNCAFAGHSLGEYAALASVGDVLPLESLVDVVFYRGMTMQSAVQRDEQGRSNYGMAAVNPARVSKSFNDTALRYVVDSIARISGDVLEIVNFNVENWQYVTAGSLPNLDVLTNVLNYIKVSDIDLQKLMETMPLEDVKKHLSEIIDGVLEKTRAKEAQGRIKLERGHATVPLPGIDVPFHSSFLLSGVAPFRSYLAKKFNPSDIDVAQLSSKYIPNLTAQPFSTKKSYIENVYGLTSSPRLAKVLKNWTDDKYVTPAQQQRLGYIILVELLAYQFASPVRWIETQDQLFKSFQIERLIEVGPSPTLSGMATRTLNLKYQAYDDALSNRRQNLCIAKNSQEIYYEFENAEEEPVAAATTDSGASATPAVTTAAPVAAAPVATAGPAAPVSDVPVTATEVIHVVIAQKLKKTVDEVPLSKAIKDLVGGKSTLQNEILGDLQKEFNNAVPEKAEETPLDELGASLDGSFSGSLGKHTSTLVAKMIGAKMPGGFTLANAKAYLSTTYGLGSGRVDGVLLMGLTMEPASRLGAEAEAKTWLDSVTQAYAKKAGVTLSAGGSGTAAGGAGGAAVAMINSEEFDALKAKQEALIYQQLNLYAHYLQKDLRDGHKLYEQEKTTTLKLQAELDQWLAEHGDFYAEGITPSFSPLKARRYDSYWNWVRQDALEMWYAIIYGKLAIVDREVTTQCLGIMNRAYPQLLDYMRYNVENCAGDKGETYRLAKEFGQALIENCVEVLTENPVYKDVNFPTGPSTTITEKGDIQYNEVPRPGCRKFSDYVKDMASGSKISEYSNRLKVQQNLGRLYKIIRNQNKMKKTTKLAIRDLYGDVLRAMSMSNTIVKENRSRQRRLSSTGRTAERKRVAERSAKSETIPFLHLKRKNVNDPNGWEFSNRLTATYLDVLNEVANEGITFAHKCVLLTGAGKGSIGSEILKGLVSGGAKVVVTTSRFSKSVTEYFQSIYQTFGSRGSELVVVPFNQGSKQDVQALVDYIYDPKGLGWDLDYVVPFAAMPENGRQIDDIDSKSELAHRMMLTNLIRLLGSIKSHKQSIGSDTRPAQVILPLSPNHGNFGSDGLYSESKISLETLFSRWYSEDWSSYLLITGAVIGWTRGTGLMSPNNMIAEGMEALGIRTFSATEMSFNILGLMHPSIVELCQNEPVWADLNGGFQYIPNLQEATNQLRQEIRETAEIRNAVAADNSLDFKIVNGDEADRKFIPHKITPRANMKFDFPELKTYDNYKHLSHLKGMLDLDKVIVVTGFGEVSPWGNARTRWEMEANGEFSLEGCIEMSWIMGHIKHHHGNLKNGTPYSGWVDAKTNEPVEDKDIKSKYEKQILEHSGIRFVDPSVMDGYDPNKKMIMQEIVVDHDLEPFSCSQDEAQTFKLQQGDKADVYETAPEEWVVVLKKGATLYVPKALRFDRLVAGQIPTGWDAARYGVPKDIIDQVDPVALFNIVSTVEAFVSCGITDPYEFYKYVHVSEIGNTSGSGVGGQQAQRGLFRDRLLDKPVQKDILQESFINTMPAWVNLLLLSASGPIKTPTNACATSAVSVELAVDSILTGKAKIMIAGATEDVTEESSYEFANMKATSNTVDELAHGRTPSEMSRPTTTTRSGFMESHGAGNHILMTAATAIEIGAPIYGIIALTNTASDKEGRSVPAPGAGILTTARESSGKRASPLLNFKYRSRQLKSRRSQIKLWLEAEYDNLREELDELKASGELDIAAEQDWLQERSDFIDKEAKRQESEAFSTWSHNFFQHDTSISPLRGALAVYGLTVDDINVASFHGTSTKANDKNESRVLNSQLKHLGRSKGNALLAITQKYLTGHPKGPAASWMANGMIQCLLSGLIPGNRNADNVDEVMKEFEYIVYPSRSIQTDGLKAGLLKSFGFGQAGTEILIIHPDYILGALEESDYNAYKARNAQRYAKAYRYLHDSLTGVSDFIQVKDAPPYSDELEHTVYLNPNARAQYSKEKKTWTFDAKSATANAVSTGDAEATKQVLLSLTERQAGKKGVGVDVELTSTVNVDNDTFVERNFTPAEVSYCASRPDPQASFTGRWSAKEAVFKAISSFGDIPSDGAGAPLNEIEITSNEETGAPQVQLIGKVKTLAEAAGIKEINVSISHSGSYSMAVALAQ
ncbi:fatty acid synthase [Absidia repens]|uniref:Fatty acid synthase n=1 Tax=Absidia repens TaxID=90262 RepID=A0A1X2IQ13_9FUNG|nr:fatty acid synthase [Absidia repens]